MTENEPYIFVIEGCCMSSYLVKTVCDLMIEHGYNVNKSENVRREGYKKNKNVYYEENMNLFDLLKKSFDCEKKNLILKLPFRYLKKKEIYNLIKQQKGKVVFIRRYNKLDELFCRYRDWKYKRKGTYETFSDWRKSDERRILKFDKDNNQIIRNLIHRKEMDEEQIQYMKEFFQQEEILVSEKLVSLCFDEWNKLFQCFDLKLEKDVFDKFFKNTIIKKPIPHATVIKKEKLEDLIVKLKQNGLFEYYR